MLPPDILSPNDFILAPIFFLIIWAFAKSRRDKKYGNALISKYYLPALNFRILGNFLAALIYQYYYHGGDTFEYYWAISNIWDAFIYRPALGLELIFEPPTSHSWDAISFRHPYLKYPDTGAVIRIGGFLSLFTANSYLGIAFAITALTFGGCWRLYKTFVELYPNLYREFAWAILFIPSVCFFGTGIQKDSITMGAIGYLTYSCYLLFIKREFTTGDVIIALINFALLFYIKPYILMAFLPGLIIWIFWKYRSAISNSALKTLAGPLFILFIAGFGYYTLVLMGTYYRFFALENVINYTEVVQNSMVAETAITSGSGYSLGSYAPTPIGLLSVAPQAIIVSLFRPFLWEVNSPLLAIAGLEGFISMIMTLYVLWKVGVLNTFRILISNPEVAFALTFALVFAFAVGFSSYNFGALMRYKIPALPFYFAGLVILWNEGRKKSFLGL